MKFHFKLIKPKLIFLATLGCIVMIASTSCLKQKNFDVNELRGTLSIVGSSSTQEVFDALADAFMKKHKKVEVIKSGAGSAQAAIAVMNKTAQIGDLSRELQKNEHPENFDVYKIALDGIAVCTNKKNHIENLQTSQLKEIFSGKITNWNEISKKNGPIVVLGRDEASGTRTSFESIINEKNSCKYLIIQDNNGKIKEKIKNDENAIGYITFSSVDDSVNTVSIDGVAPTSENVLNSTYKLSLPINLICLKNLNNKQNSTGKYSNDELVNEFFNSVFSSEGKKIIQAAKFIPINNNCKK